MKYTVNILNFGAIPCEQPQTAAIQSAIDHCFLRGGGEVQIPAGTFYTGGLRLRSNVTLHFLENAVLKGSLDPQDYFGYLSDTIEPLAPEQITDAPYVHGVNAKDQTAYLEYDPNFLYRRVPGSRWNNALIRVIDGENVAIIGETGSVINGSNCFDEDGEEHYRGPHAIAMFNTKNITLRGYTVKDSANWAHNLLACENISADHLTVLAGHDAFHFTTCRNVTIKHCGFYTGDDCVAGYGNINVLVSHCILDSACSAMRFGGTNAVIEKCKICGRAKYLFRGRLSKEDKMNAVPTKEARGTRRMISVFTYFSEYATYISGTPGNIIVRDCEVSDSRRLLYYSYGGNEIWQRGKPLANITFENIRITGMLLQPVTAYGDASLPLELTLRNISLAMDVEAEQVPLIKARHCRRILLDNVTVTNLSSDSLIEKQTDCEIILRDVDCGIPEGNLIKQTPAEAPGKGFI